MAESARFRSAGLVDAGTVLVGVTPVALMAFDKATGRVAWRMPGQYRQNAPSTAVAGGVLYVQGHPGAKPTIRTAGTNRLPGGQARGADAGAAGRTPERHRSRDPHRAVVVLASQRRKPTGRSATSFRSMADCGWIRTRRWSSSSEIDFATLPDASGRSPILQHHGRCHVRDDYCGLLEHLPAEDPVGNTGAAGDHSRPRSDLHQLAGVLRRADDAGLERQDGHPSTARHCRSRARGADARRRHGNSITVTRLGHRGIPGVEFPDPAGFLLLNLNAVFVFAILVAAGW